MLKELITGIDKLIAYADELMKVTILCIHKLIVTPAVLHPGLIQKLQ